MQTVDDIITAVTEAADYNAAKAIMAGVRSYAMLVRVADQLHLDHEGRGSQTLRRTIIEEARA